MPVASEHANLPVEVGLEEVCANRATSHNKFYPLRLVAYASLAFGLARRRSLRPPETMEVPFGGLASRSRLMRCARKTDRR